MNKLLRRIFFKFAQHVSNWDIFKEEANKLIKTKRLAGYDLYHYVKQKESSSPINISELLEFFHKMNKFNEDEIIDDNIDDVKPKIEAKLSELTEYVNALDDIGAVLKFCRGYGFLIYDLIFRCRDEFVLSKNDDFGYFFLKTFTDKYWYIKDLEIIINILTQRIEYDARKFKEIIGKIFKISNVDTNYTTDVYLKDFSYEFIYILDEIYDQLDVNSDLINNIGKGLNKKLIKFLIEKYSKKLKDSNFINALKKIEDNDFS